MFRIKVLATLAAISLMSACATTAPVADNSAPKAMAKPTMKAKAKPRAQRRRSVLSMRAGTYKCELNRKVRVTKVSPDRSLAVLKWGKRTYKMRAVNARSGALRYEHKKSGLTWITVVGKSMLLNTKRGKQLANECRPRRA